MFTTIQDFIFLPLLFIYQNLFLTKQLVGICFSNHKHRRYHLITLATKTLNFNLWHAAIIWYKMGIRRSEFHHWTFNKMSQLIWFCSFKFNLLPRKIVDQISAYRPLVVDLVVKRNVKFVLTRLES